MQRLTALERDKIDAEYEELLKKIEICRAILASQKKIEAIIKEELENLKKKYGDENVRQTEREQVSFTYQKIEWTYEDGALSSQDDWEARV